MDNAIAETITLEWASIHYKCPQWGYNYPNPGRCSLGERESSNGLALMAEGEFGDMGLDKKAGEEALARLTHGLRTQR